MADPALNEAQAILSMAPSTPESLKASPIGESSLEQAPEATPCLPRIPVPVIDDNELEEEVFPFSFQLNPGLQMTTG